MKKSVKNTKQWVLIGGLSGITGVLIYFFGISGVLPISLRTLFPLVWIGVGPGLIVGCLGLNHYLSQNRRSIALDIGTLFIAIAGGIVTLVFSIQGVVRDQFDYLAKSFPVEQMGEAWQMGYRGGNAVQLGADLAWDVFIFSGTVLLGIAMLKHPKFGKVLGSIGILLGVLGLAFNFSPSVWPMNPATQGLIDAGPLTGMWYLVIFAQLFRQYRTIGSEEVAEGNKQVFSPAAQV